jgi:hypothetical protein
MLFRRAEPGAAIASETEGGGFLARFRRRGAARVAAPRTRRSDLVVAGLGIALGFGCALFPWYIFFNQDKFGIRAMKFAGNRDQVAPISMGDQGLRDGPPTPADLLPATRLDLFATGTVESDAEPELPDVEAQPFPGPPVEFRMVFASAGRAMIADDSGMWVVQRGSILPDNSKVASIEQRDGHWILVTSARRVIELSRE